MRDTAMSITISFNPVHFRESPMGDRRVLGTGWTESQNEALSETHIFSPRNWCWRRAQVIVALLIFACNTLTRMSSEFPRNMEFRESRRFRRMEAYRR